MNTQNPHALLLLLALFIFPIALLASPSDCEDWLKEEGISDKAPKDIIMRMYNLMRVEDEQYFCLIDYFRQHHLTTPEYKQLFYNFMGQHNSNRGQFDSARAYIFLAIEQDSLLPDMRETLATDLATLGNIELFQSNFRQALHYFEQALEVVNWNGRPYVVANIFSVMGVCYLELEMPGNAIAHFSQALEYSIRDTLTGATGRRLIIRHNIGVVHNVREQYQRALNVLEPLLDSLEEVDYPYLERLLHSSIGYSYLQTKQLDLAEQHMKTILGDNMNFDINQEELYYYLLELYHQQGAHKKMAPILDAISEHYIELGITPIYEHFFWLGQYRELSGQPADSVAQVYKKGLSLIPEDSLPTNRARFYEALADLYKSEGQLDLAFQHQKLYSEALLEQQAHDQNRAAEDIAVAYDVKEYRTRAEKANAKEKLSLARAEVAEQRTRYTSWAAAFSGITLLLLGFSYWQYRQQSKKLFENVISAWHRNKSRHSSNWNTKKQWYSTRAFGQRA